MNRQEKRKLVCQLYKDGKSMREIAKEVHMSFGDIGSITKKLNQELEPESQEKSKESQALELLKNGSDPVKVAISLDLSPAKTESIYKQFWKLRGLHHLLYLYKNVKADISLLSRVHQVVKRYNLGKKDIINIVKYADELTFLKEEVHELETQFDHLLKQRHDANETLLSAKRKHAELVQQIDKYNDVSVRKNAYIENLNDEIEKLENQISKLKNSDGYYTRFEQSARQKLNSIMEDNRWILALAIDAVIESMRKEPFKEMMISGVITDEYKVKLLELCEVLFNKLSKHFMDFTLEINSSQDINAVNTSTSAPSIVSS